MDKEEWDAQREKTLNKDIGPKGASLGAWQGGLKKILSEKYRGCKSIWEAVQVKVLRNRIEREEK